MSRSFPPVNSSAQNLGPGANDPRKSVFKMLSETLRPPQPLSTQRAVAKYSLSKINKKSPRPAQAKSSLPSMSVKGRTDSRRPPQTNRPPGKEKETSGVGGGEKESKSMPDCHLNNVLRSAKHCLYELRDAKDTLSRIVANDEQISKGIRKTNPTEDHFQLAQVALNITNLCRDAFVPAHRLNQTAIALYSAEDFLRYPSDIRTFDLNGSKGRVKLPDESFNEATVLKLRQVVDSAAEAFNNFDGRGRMGEVLKEVLYCILRGYQDFYAAALGCQEIFKVLLYTGPQDKAHLQQFLLALAPIDRSDMLVEIQDLRRIFDEIVIFLEKMSWGSFVVYRLAGGLSANAFHESGAGSIIKSSIPIYPAYPLLKAQGKKSKQKKVVMDSVEPCGTRFEIRRGFNNALVSTLTAGKEKKDVKSEKMKKSKFSKKNTVPLVGEEEEYFQVFHKQQRPPNPTAPAGDSPEMFKKSVLNYATDTSSINSLADMSSSMNIS